MTFNTANIDKFINGFKRIAGATMSPQAVDLYKGDTVQVKMYVGRRRAASSELTGGMEQENQYATIDAADWDAKVPRGMPQKGDVVHWAGRRMAVEDCQVIAPDGATRAFYKARLRG